MSDAELWGAEVAEGAEYLQRAGRVPAGQGAAEPSPPLR